MPCYRPLTGYRSTVVSEATGKRRIVFSRNEGYSDLEVSVPCGQCTGCRLERSRQWAIRCMHEASLHEDNCFITLTYDDAHLPPDGGLVLDHFQKFMKRLRKKFGAGIRFYHCGEYGEQFKRPHYHACIFGFDFPDKMLFKRCPNGNNLYVSADLQKLWTFGYSTIGAVTFDSSAYVARYILKKRLGKDSENDEQYLRFDSATGELYSTVPREYTTMSRRPGIGRGWFDRFSSDVYPRDQVIVKDRPVRPPKYYDNLYEAIDPNAFSVLKMKRLLKSKIRSETGENSLDRLAVREEVKSRLISARLPRPLDITI